MSNVFVFDVETDGLDATKIHCLVAYNGDNFLTYTNTRDIFKFLSNDELVLIGHNIQRYDIPTLNRLLGIEIKAKLIDTLTLSWYLEPERQRHGLEEWGEEFGIEKPKIDDWENQSVEDYIHRCTEDVKINVRLWKRFKNHLTMLYGTWENAQPFLDYLERKMDAVVEQEKNGWRLDHEYVLKSLQMLQETQQQKLASLVLAMPSQPVWRILTKPKKPYKKDGTYSTIGAKWFAKLKRLNLPEDYDGEIKELITEVPANPNSHIQVKDWLYSMGWKPETFKYKRDKETGDVKSIPQINLEHGGGLCPSVLKLRSVSPSIDLLDSLGVISHRIGLLNGFLAYESDGRVKATVQGLTNTLRWKHAGVVNLPKVGKPYGEEVRGALICDDGTELCGSDMASLEDRLKQHYIYPLDPDYVNEMNTEDYDPHLSLALLAKEVTIEQVNKYKDNTDKSIKPIRDIFKNGNYACQYGAGPPRLALTADISLEKAKQVWEIYWQKNWAIKEVAKQQTIKTIKGQMWLLNPISGFWYSLRYEKDIFSTLIQGSASYVFDRWVDIFRQKRKQITAQFHDEVVLQIKLGHREQATKLLKNAIKQLNDELKLNRELAIDVQFGIKYSGIH